MKKIFLFVAAVAMSIAASAMDLWTGSKHVSWTDGGLQIEAAKFATAQPGQKIVISFAAGATDGIELKVINKNFDHLAGSRESAWITDATTYEQFLTQAAVDSLKLYGLELIGANFTVTKVELNDGKQLKEGLTLWTGYFWADEWSTMELYYNAYAGVDFSQYNAIRFYTEAAGTGYVINFMKAWGEGGKFADQTNMTDGEGYKELALTDELRSAIASAGHWMIQVNKEQLAAFNVTDIVLVAAPEPVMEYYLVGSMNNWEIDPDYLFTPNPANEGEYMLNVNLTLGATLKVIGTADGGANKTWYPDGVGNDYTVDAAHAGGVSVYFRPEGNVEGWYAGYFYVTEASAQGFDSINATSKAVKRIENGQIVIIKNGIRYNALGAEIK